MALKILLTLALSFLGGVLYRMGGAAGYNTKFRDFGIPTVSILLFFFWVFPKFDVTDLSLVLTWGAIFGVQTTYFKKKGTDSRWYNWCFTGVAYSLSWLPTVVAQNIPRHISNGVHTHYLGFLLRTIICTLGTVIFSEIFGNAVLEENARGEIEILTLPLLFI